MAKKLKPTRTDIALNNAERQFKLERAAVKFANLAEDELFGWETQRARDALLKAAVSYWRGVQR